MKGWIGCLAALALTCSACADGGAKGDGAAGGALQTSVPGATVFTFEHGGLTREYILYTPSGYEGADDLPLMLLFHGNGGRADDFLLETAMTSLADTAQIMLLYPQGSLLDGSPHWNPSVPGEGNKSATDDLGFIGALLDAVAMDYALDEGRVYAAGYSNGAFMTYGLACTMSDRIAAVGGVSGTMLGGTEGCAPTRPMPVITFRGTDDFVVPYEGGPGYPSSDEVLSFWVDFNATNSEPTLTSDGEVERTLYEGGQSGSEVARYKVDGGDHVWFDLDFQGANTGQLIWDFVSRYDLNGLRE